MMERTPQLQWYESVRKSASRRFPKLLVLPHDLGGWRFQGVMGQLQATLNSDSLVIASECLYFLQNQNTSDMQAIYLLIILLIPIVYYNIHTCKSLTIQHGTLILNLGMPSNPLPEHRTCLSRPYTQRQQYTAVLTHRPGQDRWPHVLPKAFVFPPAPQAKTVTNWTGKFSRLNDLHGDVIGIWWTWHAACYGQTTVIVETIWNIYLLSDIC